MKKHVLIPLAVIFLSVIGCSKPENGGVKDNPQPPAPPQEQITIPSTVDVTPVVPPEGGDAKITFTAATAWTASVISTKADSWVDVNPKSGNPGPAEIKITTTPNDTYVERNATIRINCGGQTKDVVLTQKQVDNITVTKEREALMALYHSTDGDHWTKNDNWGSNKPLSEWYGVSLESGCVYRIMLEDNNLNGPVSDEIGDLENLAFLDLSSNKLSGEIVALP